MYVALSHPSAKEYERLRSGHLTPEMAARYLREEHIELRTFLDILLEFYPDSDLQERLTEAFLSCTPEANPASVSRRIRNWLSGQNHPTNREDIFHIAFALNLSEIQANSLLGFCTDYGIHYRDGHDVIYAWFLRTGRDYSAAREFYASLPTVPLPQASPANPDSHLTQTIRDEFLRVATTDGLRTCYESNLQNFGILHLRAYHYFSRYMNQLLRPDSALHELPEPDYSVETVMNLYLSLHVPSGKNYSQYNLVQRLIKHNWPNATSLKNIYRRRADVPRKLLLLLYVITENLLDEDYNTLAEEEAGLQTRLEDHWWSLNAILTDCGMPLLDPCNATDWLVLYSLTATEESMSERMEQVIEQLFVNE